MLLDLDITLKLLTSAVSIAALVISLVGSRRREINDRITALTDRLEKAERTGERMNQRMDGLPSKDDIHALELTVTRVASGMEAMNATLAGQREIMVRLEAIVTRHEDHLLEKSR